MMNCFILKCLRKSIATLAIILGISCYALNVNANIMSDDNTNITQTIDNKNYLLNTETKEASIQKGYYNTRGEFVIPQSVTYNGEKYTVTAIGARCFENCDSITNIVIPTTIKVIGEQAFYYCRRLNSIIIPEGVANIPNRCFDDCI